MVTQPEKKKAKIPTVSIIIVNYQSKESLFKCLSSLKHSNPKVSHEVIIVDNDEKKVIREELKRKFPNVKYIPIFGNRGYAVGNNQGSKKALGEYLLFLNPDTIVNKNAIDTLVKSIKDRKNIGIVSPQLLNEKKQIYPLQCSEILTPQRALIAHSIINRVLPNNPISRNFWYLDWDRSTFKEVGNVEGSALFITKSLFEALNGFDEKFFMYFEDTDLCYRVRKEGLKIIFEPKAKIIHYGQLSTHDKKKALEVYRTSRGYYLKKHFGITGILTNIVFWFLDRWKSTLLFIVLGLLALTK